MVRPGPVGYADGQDQQHKPQRQIGPMQPPGVVQRQGQRLNQDRRDHRKDHGRQRQPDQNQRQHKGAQLVMPAGAVGQVVDGVQAPDQGGNSGPGGPQGKQG